MERLRPRTLRFRNAIGAASDASPRDRSAAALLDFSLDTGTLDARSPRTRNRGPRGIGARITNGGTTCSKLAQRIPKAVRCGRGRSREWQRVGIPETGINLIYA